MKTPDRLKEAVLRAIRFQCWNRNVQDVRPGLEADITKAVRRAFSAYGKSK